MPPDIGPYSQDVLTRIYNVQWGAVYVVITGAKSDYAFSDMDGVSILETKRGPGPQSEFMTGTLIECSTSAGERFATLDSKLVGGPGGEGGGEGSTLIAVMVYPKTDEVRARWWDYATAYQGVNDGTLGPFRWLASFRAFNPCRVNFKIKNKPHLTQPAEVGDVIVQAYPISGAHQGLGGQSESVVVEGFSISSYRTDTTGAGPIYACPPEWRVDVVQLDDGVAVASGLRFGKDPPLIGSDIPQ
jgi:hypothetical protein